jgi:formate dehydrogenase major subunit
MAHGCHPFGNAKARAVVWNFPDPIPQHREPIYSTRPELVATSTPRTTTGAPAGACPCCTSRCSRRTSDIGKEYPLIMTSGRLVEYEGGGDETRSNPYLAELQQEMFVEINPAAANDRGIRNGEVGLGQDAHWRAPEGQGPGDRARGPRRPCSCPCTLRGVWQGEDISSYYPEGAKLASITGEAVQHGRYLRL